MNNFLFLSFYFFLHDTDDDEVKIQRGNLCSLTYTLCDSLVVNAVDVRLFITIGMGKIGSKMNC